MPYPKGTPRPPNAGRRAGTPNKRTIGTAKLAALADLGLTTATGIGPGMAYDLQWQMVRRIAGWIEREQAKPRPNQRQLETLCDRMSRVLEKLLPYEKPRLAAITVKGDTDSPLRVSPTPRAEEGDLSMSDRLKGARVLVLGGSSGRRRDRDDRLTLPGQTRCSDQARREHPRRSARHRRLIAITSIKYVAIAMRVDNDGEGGILALMALSAQASRQCRA